VFSWVFTYFFLYIFYIVRTVLPVMANKLHHNIIAYAISGQLLRLSVVAFFIATVSRYVEISNISLYVLLGFKIYLTNKILKISNC